jgi:hypothetical protein
MVSVSARLPNPLKVMFCVLAQVSVCDIDAPALAVVGANCAATIHSESVDDAAIL